MAHFTTSDGLTLVYSDEGTGVPILCLAGLTRTMADFDYVAPYLGDNRLIRMDYRGRGASDRDDDWRNYSLEVECRDVLELLDHLGLDRVAILGTSRGGLNAMCLAMGAKERLLGVALNDIGPVVDPTGLQFIMGYLGRDPNAKTHLDAARTLQKNMTGFVDVPFSRWMEEAEKHFQTSGDGLCITYDPKLRDAMVEQGAQPAPDIWPFFDALDGLPLAVLRGENSDLLSRETFTEMQRRRPDMMSATVMGRGHVPFLDEAESVATLQAWARALA